MTLKMWKLFSNRFLNVFAKVISITALDLADKLFYLFINIYFNILTKFFHSFFFLGMTINIMLNYFFSKTFFI